MGRTIGSLRILLPAALFAILAPTVASAMNFEAKPVGGSDWVASIGWDVNGQGDVVGYYDDTGPVRGFLYRNGAVIDILPPGWTNAQAQGISESGNICGKGTVGGQEKAFLRSGGAYTEIDLPGWTDLDFYGVNNNGQIAGSGNDGGGIKGILCSAGACTSVIPPGWLSARCEGINEGGHMACRGFDGSVSKGFLYDGGSYTEILPPGWTSASAYGINDSGQIVGSGNDGTGSSCFIYQGGSYTVIPPPGDNIFIECRGIDQNGSVAGFTQDALANSSPVVWGYGQYHTFTPPRGAFMFQTFGKMRNGHVTGMGLTPGPRAFAARVTPAPDLKAGPYDGPGNVGPNAAVSITASLAAGIFKAYQGEYWLVSQQPTGTWSYDAGSQSWQPGISPAARGPLRDFANKRVFTTTGLPAGLHNFLLAVDLNMNGVPDAAEWYADTLYFFVR